MDVSIVEVSIPESQTLVNSVHQNGFQLVFTNVGKTVDGRQILADVNGMALPGEMLAIMGPSGAGKTTLLNCLGGRLPADSGQITLDSKPIDKKLRRKISYVLQNETFFPDLTCWQTLWYTAQLRLPESVSIGKKKEIVLEVVDALDMRKCLHTKIGSVTDRGLSGGEKKRTNIACELITDPGLMLLDEPTSGLDYATAHNLISTLKNFAKKSNKTIILTIHQPSSQIFHMFDKLLLLCDGKVAYYGKVSYCEQFFSSIGLNCPSGYNLADFILEQVKTTAAMKDTVVKRAVSQMSEPWYPAVISRQNTTEEGLQNGQVVSENPMLRMYNEETSKWPTGFWLQFSVLFTRSIHQLLPRIFSREAIIELIITSIFAGMVWFRIEPEERRLSDRHGMLFFILSYIIYTTVIASINTVPVERPVINKERLAGYYRLSAFFLAKVLSEFPLIQAIPFGIFTITYWMSGLNYSFLVYLQMLSVNLLVGFIGQGFGMFLGSLILDSGLAMMISMALIAITILSGGFYVKFMPFWLDFAKYCSFISMAGYSLLTIDITNTAISCTQNASQFVSCKTDNETARVSQQELLERLTLTGQGWLLYHYLLVLTAISFIPLVLTYVVHRTRKPHSN